MFQTINKDINIGSDITSDGIPNLVIAEWSGGTHCCYYIHLFDIGHNFRYIQSIALEHGGRDIFKNIDRDQDLEIIVKDWNFAYWRTCFATSPAPDVIFKYNGEKYEVSHKLMKRKIDEDYLIKSKSSKLKKLYIWSDANPPYQLWYGMLDLIYSGNMGTAYNLCHQSWPNDVKGEDEFISKFNKQLQKSKYWKDIKAINNIN